MIDKLDRAKLGSLFKELRLLKNMTLEQFYGDITTHVNNLSAIENGGRVIGKRLAKDIINYHNISFKWLSEKEGKPFLSNVPYQIYKQERNITRLRQEPSEGEVPYYHLQLSEMVFDGPEAFQEAPEFYVNFRPFNDCTAYLPIYGDSMYPKFASGEIIAIKEVINQEVILWGEAYLVVTNKLANNMVTLKLLYEHEESDKLILRASNPNFKGDTVIDKRAISKLFIVKGKITRNQL
ncbi:XRE family transcriptional regulator [Olivibacter sp. SDN3]|uniref:LexA family transcriptional regulator n=1 Tax=Olivibacter sp. SDN3 TaxID=2764720 RepID=UPI0016511DDF|nr:XRE family transcriptional regulator [Olivibacter sp. SDN3]QNL47695.1 XRE family transcriptional regulator [Olivibacter sp. SDN3]